MVTYFVLYHLIQVADLQALTQELGLWMPKPPSPAAAGALTVAVDECAATIMTSTDNFLLLQRVDEVAAAAVEGSPLLSTTSTPLRALHTAVQALLLEWEETLKADRERVKELGGLYVVGTCRHESRRIDNQLRGRAGRQGDPGTSRFFLSLEDEIFRIFGADKMAGKPNKMWHRGGPKMIDFTVLVDCDSSAGELSGGR